MHLSFMNRVLRTCISLKSGSICPSNNNTNFGLTRSEITISSTSNLTIAAIDFEILYRDLAVLGANSF